MVVIVILAADNDDAGNLSSMAQERVEGGLRLYHKLHAAKLLLTGGFGSFNRTSLPHAYYVAQYLLARGIPEIDILPFVLSSNTVEDAALSKRALESFSFEKLCVVTSQFHVPRAKLIFSHFLKSEKLACYGTPDGINPKELRKRQAHESEAIQIIRTQGGILFKGKILNSCE